jgi:peptidyl-prolyl cis-trans isomerase SurA
MVKKNILSLILSVVLLSGAYSKDYELLDRIIVTVEKDVVTEVEVKKEIQKKFPGIDVAALSQKEYDDVTEKIIDFLINKKLITQYAESINLIPSEQELEIVINNILQNNNISLEELETELKKENKNLYELKDDLRYQLTVQKIKDREIMPYVNISEYEINAEIANDDIGKDTEYKISHILLKADNNELEKSLKKIYDNEDSFSDLAGEISDGPNASVNGDLGWNKIDDLPEIFIEFIRNAKTGEISNPIKSANGTHIIKIESIRNSNKQDKVMVKQFKFQEISLKKNYITPDDELKNKLEKIKILINDGLQFSEAVKMYSDDQINIDPEKLDWINYDSLFPEFKKNLDDYPRIDLIGPFKTEKGWHLLKVYGFQESDITDKAIKEKTKIKLARKKTEIRFIDWIESLKQNSKIKFIEN